MGRLTRRPDVPPERPDGGPVAQLAREVHQLVVDERGDRYGGLAREDLARIVRRRDPLLGEREVGSVVQQVLGRVEGLGPLDRLLADAAVTEVMVNGPGQVWVERQGRLERTSLSLDTAEIEHVIEKIVGPLGLRVDRSSPLVDARLPDGSRVNAVVPPLAIDGPCLTVRRFGVHTLPLDAFCTPGVASLLAWSVDSRLNVLVSGGTGAGKTTLLNALARFLPPTERIVSIEDVAELRLEHDHVIRLEARPCNVDGTGGVSIRDLVRNALRMRPDRIIVGEVRGGEALDMLQAMNTGHEGSLSTCHANTASDALRRLETMILMGDVALPIAVVREQVVSSLDLVVQVSRRDDRTRGITQVGEVPEVLDGPGWLAVRQLLGPGDRLVALPSRPPRRPGAAAPDERWIEA